MPQKARTMSSEIARIVKSLRQCAEMREQDAEDPRLADPGWAQQALSQAASVIHDIAGELEHAGQIEKRSQ